MKKILFLALAVVSCDSSRNVASVVPEHSSEKAIKYLTTGLESEHFVNFASVNLKKEGSLLKLNDQVIFTEISDSEYFYEIYDSNFVIISTKKKSNWSWSSHETVNKDSVYIIDLISKQKAFVSLENTYFARKVSDLTNIYHYSKEKVINEKYTYRYGVYSINIAENELFLVQPDLSIKKYQLTRIE